MQKIARNMLLAFFLLFTIFTTNGRTQARGLFGYVKWFSHVNVNRPYRLDRLGTRLQLNLSREIGKLAFYSALDFNYEESKRTGQPGESRSDGMDVYPVETYIDYYGGHFDVRVGKQFIFWGTTDWINPTDNINPWDYKNISAEIEDYRIPVNAIKLDAYLGRWTLEGVGVLRFEPNLIPYSFPDLMGPFLVRLRQPDVPSAKMKNIEFGFRLSSQVMRIDYSFSYLHGFDKFPSFQFRPTFTSFGAPSELLIQPSYEPYQVFGADFVTTKGKFAFKGEGAYYMTSDSRGTDPFVENPHVQYVLGLDFSPRDDLTLNGQFVNTVRFKYDRLEEEKRWQSLGMSAANVADRTEQSVSARIQYNPIDFLTFQLIGVMNLQDRDFFLLPILNYEIADGVNIYGGATLFHGPQESPFGRNQSYSRAFVEVKYSFASE